MRSIYLVLQPPSNVHGFTIIDIRQKSRFLIASGANFEAPGLERGIRNCSFNVVIALIITSVLAG